MSTAVDITRAVRAPGIAAFALVVAIELASGSAGAAPTREVVVDLPAAALPALRALGDVSFYTSSARPLRSLKEIRVPEDEVVLADLGLARGLMGLLRSAGVPLSGGAVGLSRLISAHHLGSALRGPRAARLLVMSRRPTSEEAVLGERGGGVPLVFRGPDGARLGGGAGAAPAPAPSRPVAPVAGGAPLTSFGPLSRVTTGTTARTREFSPAQVRTPPRQARPGQTLVVLHISRDFGAGLGKVSFLFGSGVLLEPDFSPLVLVAGGRRYRPVGSFAEGFTLEVVYELPGRAPRELLLEDGSSRWPLAPLIVAPSAAL